MACNASMGVKARMMSKDGSPTYTWASTDKLHEFYGENVQRRVKLMHSMGITGSLDIPVGRTRMSQEICAGRIQIPFNHDESLVWLPRALGEVAGSTDIQPQATVTESGLLVDRVQDVFTYEACYINRLLLAGKASQGGSDPDFIQMGVEILGTKELTSDSWPTTPAATDLEWTDIRRRPLVFSEGTLTLGSNAIPIMAFSLAIDNQLRPRWTNSLLPTSICPSGRAVILRTTTPFTSTESTNVHLAGDNVNPSSVTTASLVFTDGTTTVTFGFNALQWAKVGPVVNSRGEEIALVTEFHATSTSQVTPPTNSEAEIYITIA